MKSALFLACALAAAVAHAGPFDGLADVQRANDHNVAQQQAEKARAAAQAQLERQRVAAIRAKADEEKRLVAAAEQNRIRDRLERQEDEERALELESRRLDLDAKRARVKRTDDYVDAELARESARTDVIQSQADGQRAVGRAVEAVGRGKEACASKWIGKCE